MQAIVSNPVLVLTRRAAHEIQFGGSSNISSSINDRASSPRKTAAVLGRCDIFFLQNLRNLFNEDIDEAQTNGS